jgi:hypothetical protein
MKHLRRINETLSSEITSEVEDICLEFDFLEITYSIRETNYYWNDEKKDAIRIYIKDRFQRFFRLEDISEVIDRLEIYSDMNGLQIDIGIHEVQWPDDGDESFYSLEEMREEFSGEELYTMAIYIFKV